MNDTVFVLLVGLISYVAGWFSCHQTSKYLVRKHLWEKKLILAAMAQMGPKAWSKAWDQEDMETFQKNNNPEFRIYQQNGVIFVSFNNRVEAPVGEVIKA